MHAGYNNNSNNNNQHQSTLTCSLHVPQPPPAAAAVEARPISLAGPPRPATLQRHRCTCIAQATLLTKQVSFFFISEESANCRKRDFLSIWRRVHCTSSCKHSFQLDSVNVLVCGEAEDRCRIQVRSTLHRDMAMSWHSGASFICTASTWFPN